MDGHLGKLDENIDIFEVSKHFDAVRAQVLKTTPSSELQNAKARLGELKEMVKYANNMQASGFKETEIRVIVNYQLDLMKLIDFPNQLGKRITNAEGLVVPPSTGCILDSKGIPFGDLRKKVNEDPTNPSSACGKFEKFCNESGGDYNIVIKMHQDQGNDSWSPVSKMAKAQIMDMMNVDKNEFWHGGKEHLNLNNEFNNLNKLHDEFPKKYPKIDPEKFKETMLMNMAFNHLLLSRTTIPGINRKNNTLTIFRTESLVVLENGLGKDNVIKNKLYKNGLKRGPCESGSNQEGISASNMQGEGGSVNGSHLTSQEVPLHLVFDSYLALPYMVNYEKEFLFMGRNIPTKYLGQIENTTMGKENLQNQKASREVKALADEGRIGDPKTW
jgi:hypothetical protein